MEVETLVPSSEEAERAQTLLGGAYDVIRRLGRGAMGTVYLAHDVVLDRKVAIKAVPECGSGADTLRAEAAAIARVESPFVVRIYASGAHQGRFFYVMEHVDGPSLRTILSELAAVGQYLPLGRAVTLLRQIATGAGDIHAAGLVHRDLKPENVVIEAGSGKPTLVDFGLTTRAGAPLRPGFHGTVGYMPPELGDGIAGRNDPRMDVFALGAIAYEVLTGRPAYEGDDVLAVLTQQLTTPVPRPSLVRPDAAPFDDLVLTALARDPEDRFADGLAFARAVEEAAAAVRPRRSNRRPQGIEPTNVSDGTLQVLVVEDDDASRTFFVRAARLAFQGRKIEVRAARSGAEALLMAEKHMPHLLLLDYQLPGLDGIEMLGELREIPKGGDARVLVLTANLPEGEQWRFEALGVEHIIRKPVPLKALVDRMLEIADRERWL